MLGRLDDADGGVFKKAQGTLKDIAEGHEIGVEQKYELGGAASGKRVLQTIIYVAGLAVPAFYALNVEHAEFFGELADRGTRTIVENPDAQVVVANSLSTNDGALEDREIFVERGDEDVDGRLQKGRRLVGVSLAAAVQIAGHEKLHQHSAKHGADFHNEKNAGPDTLEEILVKGQREEDAPIEISQEGRTANESSKSAGKVGKLGRIVQDDKQKAQSEEKRRPGAKFEHELVCLKNCAEPNVKRDCYLG